MKKNVHQACCLIFVLIFFVQASSVAQCGAGTTRDTLNWDYLDFLPNSGAYVTPTAFLTLAHSQNQRFTFGTQVVSFTHNFSGANVGGDVATHTAEVGSFGNGADIRFRNNGTITFTFQNAVQNLKFSMYDIDRGQRVQYTAFNGAASRNISATTLAGTVLSVNNNNTAVVTVSSASGSAVDNVTNTPGANATVNIEIAGPVTSVTLTVTNSTSDASDDGSFFISDISACSAGTFPINYYAIAKPYAGQPSYFLAVRDNNIYYVNVDNGVARLLFRDPGHTNINSLAYDPYRHMVYYTYSLSSNSVNDKTVRRYDYDMDTMGIFLNNVNTIGVPTFESGVESGAAAFYNNSYYLGIEGTNMGDDRSNRESIIWKIDFNAAYGASSIAQVYAVPADDGNGNGLHDWGDIGINDGILFDFDGAANNTDFYHKDLLTGNCINIKPSPTTLIPRQVSVDWNGQMYNSGSPGATAAGTVVPYNENGTVNTARQYTMRYQGVAVTGSWGDAAEAFKPKTDYGDAPATYDPAGADPGTHEKNDSIYLGTLRPGIEWVKKTSANATGDGTEEDGIPGLQVLSTGISNFTVPVRAFNNTNRNATLAGWVDANGNGRYDAAEGTTLVIPPGPAVQNVTLLWSGINCTLPAFSTTFMRLRITTVDQGMTTARPNGYFDNGEIEDHVVTVNLLLPDENLSLQALKISDRKVRLTWKLNQETENSGYELQRSSDGNSWKTINTRSSTGSVAAASYNYTDFSPERPESYYRVGAIKSAGSNKYSAVRKIKFDDRGSVKVLPNPASTSATLNIESPADGLANINVLDYTGRTVFETKTSISKGLNEVDLPVMRRLSNGIYKVRVKINNQVYVTTLVVMKS